MFEKSFFLLLLSLSLVHFSSCSSSQTQSEPSAPELADDSAPSGADAVGSIPEDMLAADEKGAATDSAPGANEGAAAEADPFKDLKEDHASVSAVSGEEKAAENVENSGKMESYKVKSGDTLMKIAFTLYGDIDRWKEIYDLNKNAIKKASQLKAGTELKYEAPLQNFQPEQLSHSYLIKQGDTLANIADDVYGRKMKYKKLQKFNSHLVKNPNRIFAGFTLYYDITEQEMAEAAARRAQKMGATSAAPSPAIPSAINPPTENLNPPAAVSVAPSTGPAPAASQPAPAPAPNFEGVPPPPPPPPAN